MSMSLEGIRVLDLSRILAGPTATQLLADLGAEVIKVERPGCGDDTRGWGPPFVEEGSDLSAYFLCANRNKQSIAIDFTTPEGADLIRRLVVECDVVVENYKPGDLARRGLDYDDLAALRPGLIWCSITGFGRNGADADRIGYDFLVQAVGGIMSITGDPEGPPMKVGVGIADVMCGMYATTGILAALRHRDRTGEGQRVDVALYDAQLAWLVNAATNTLVSNKPPRRLGNRHPNIAPYQTYPTAAGDLALAVGNDAQFRRLMIELGDAELGHDPRFALNRDRVLNVDALEEALVPLFATAPAAAWVDRLSAAGIPAGLVRSVDDVLDDPDTEARGMVTRAEDAPEIRLLGNPLHLSKTPVRPPRRPPHLDEHRAEVLRLLNPDKA
ncbi:CaiB/BaiF CoA-transferase family protein [Falsirhodobacter sp. alg1]|uniref:CaiB/BaiF CoA transferase family protein n=1 Tax=Falsirhodobacter sp. alg1 TaxID=1472418 RepID=UPI00128F3780|nr:CoA transferase [Falsirhodobacter sp. alg1]